MSTLQRISITALTAVVLGTLGASAGELPQYEVTGFPHQSAANVGPQIGRYSRAVAYSDRGRDKADFRRDQGERT
jgi:hypothetical protein